MVKELNWLKDNMPEGWALVHTDTSESLHRWGWSMGRAEGVSVETIARLDPEWGDIGLAPLTALLKQELGRIDSTGVNIHHIGNGDVGVRIGLGEPTYGKTEFEAVLAAYRSTR